MKRTSFAPVAAAPSAGGMLVETVIALTLFSVVLLSSIALVESGQRFSSSTLHITAVEDLAQQMLFRLEHELASATGTTPKFSLPGPLTTSEINTLNVSSTRGFPPRGTLLVDRGGVREERIHYTSIASLTAFAGLERGVECTTASDHPGNDGVDQLWCGLAEPLEDQGAPGPDEYDGIALEDGVEVYFRGDGTGFSYRKPIDPGGGNNPLNGHDLTWGAEVPEVGATLSGWVALVFEARDIYEESKTGDDVNEDGDVTDIFELGQIRRQTWDSDDVSRLEDLGLGPTNVLQERCNLGGDLDGDGFADPIFLWNGATNLLHVRVFLLGAGRQDMPVVRKVESVMFLRNEPELL